MRKFLVTRKVNGRVFNLTVVADSRVRAGAIADNAIGNGARKVTPRLTHRPRFTVK